MLVQSASLTLTNIELATGRVRPPADKGLLDPTCRRQIIWRRFKNDSDQRITCYLPRANMKQTFSVVVGLVVSLICLSVVKAGDVSVKVRMTTGPQDPPTTTFASNTPKLYAIFKTEGAKTGDKIRGVLIAEDVGDVAPANTKVLETILDMEGDTDAGDFSFSKPTNGWPVGKYRVEIYVNDQLATAAKFTIKAAKKKSSDEEEEESGD